MGRIFQTSAPSCCFAKCLNDFGAWASRDEDPVPWRAQRTGLGSRCGTCRVRADPDSSSPGTAPPLGPELLHPSPKLPAPRGEVGSVFPSLIPGWKSSLPLQKSAGGFERGGVMRLGGRGTGEAFVPCGGSWGSLQPVPTVGRWVVGKLLSQA